MKNAPNCDPFLAVLIILGVLDSVISNFVSKNFCKHNREKC